ncbi:hypothetical protein BGZ98_010002 [Dissophora globulifera]|nr:hypothetical protein BGZ98_010002 [Dissophora globulifera]
MSCQLNEKDDLNDDNLATHTELVGNVGYDKRQGVVEYLMGLAPSSIPAVIPALPAASRLTSISSRTSEVQDDYEQGLQKQDQDEQDEQDASKSIQISLPTEEGRTVKRRHGEGCDNNAQVSEMARISRGRDVHRRDRQESIAAAVESTGFKKPKVHHSLTGDMGVEMSATFKNIKDCKIRIRK